MGERREQKKQETRQRISDVATRLFFERGFDAVTIEEVALAAKVSKMTVTNYFALKEELILDREDELKLVSFRNAVRTRPHGQSPIEAVRAHLHELRAQKKPLTRFDRQTVAWWRVVVASPALRSRLRELADEAAESLALDLAKKPDASTRLLSTLIVQTIRTAREEGLRMLEKGASSKKATATFQTLTEQGLSALEILANQPTRIWIR